MRHVSCILLLEWSTTSQRLWVYSPYSTEKTGPNANEIDTKKVKCTWPTPEFCIGTQRNLYSTGLRLDFASGKTQLLSFASGKMRKCASPNARDTNMLVYFALGNAKFWRQVHCPTLTPNARYFAFWWNIGL